MDSKKLNQIETPYILGQNNFSPYRNLAFFYPSYKLIEMIFEIQFLFKNITFIRPTPASAPRIDYNFKEIEQLLLNYYPKNILDDKISHAFSTEVANKIKAFGYAYVLFDIYNRNVKFNQNKSRSYKRLYSLDLALWHSMATFVFPLYAAKYSFSIFHFLIHIPKNRYFPLHIFSIFASFFAFFHLVKIGDCAADIVMNNTFRKYVFDYKKDENSLFNEEYQKLNDLDNATF